MPPFTSVLTAVLYINEDNCLLVPQRIATSLSAYMCMLRREVHESDEMCHCSVRHYRLCNTPSLCCHISSGFFRIITQFFTLFLLLFAEIIDRPSMLQGSSVLVGCTSSAGCSVSLSPRKASSLTARNNKLDRHF